MYFNMRVANIFSLHLSLVPESLLNTVVGLETKAEKPERRDRVRGITGG
jgi:hypothetical protein